MRADRLLTPVNVVGVVALAIGVTLAVTSRGHDGGAPAPAGAASPVATLTSGAPGESAAGSPSAASTPVRTATPAGNGASQRIDADRLDGLDSTAFQRRVTGSCPGAVTSVREDGSLTCRALPAATKVTWDVTAHGSRAEDVRKVLLTFPGGRLVAHCAEDANKAPTLSVYVEGTAGEGTVNGYTTSGNANGNGDGTEDVRTTPTAVVFRQGGGPVRVLHLAPEGAWQRAEVTWWIATPRGLTHVAAHVFADERSDYFDNHCTIWAVAE